MLNDNTMIKLTNRSGGSVGYTIPDLGNLHRTFQPNETKEISMGELRKLSWIPGGMVILREYLVMNNKTAIEEILNGNVEPEYFYTKDDVIKLLTSGSIEQFLDALDFASEGVLEMIKEYAVKNEVTDIRKRDAIKEKLGFDVTKAIEINRETSEERANKTTSNRRAAPISAEDGSSSTSAAPKRRVVVEK